MKICILNSSTKIVKNISLTDSLEGINLPEGEELAPRHDGEIGWRWNGDDWEVPQVEISYDKKSLGVRRLRDFKLIHDVDKYTPIRWSLLNNEQQQKVIEYRQALLDVPQQEGFPDNVTWPEIPDL